MRDPTLTGKIIWKWIVLWTAADHEPATGYMIATKKTAQAVAVAATTTMICTTEERQLGAHPTSKIVHRELDKPKHR